MREILFRGKRLRIGDWVEGGIAQNSFVEGDVCILTMRGEIYSVEPTTVGQYTGLKDKNGKRIFEGDILEHHVQGNILVNRGVVNWDERNGRWSHQLNTMNPCFYMHNPAAFEIIGNIHDNPELLERGVENAPDVR